MKTVAAHGPKCLTGEKAVYRCNLGRKIVSVCATGNSLTYRFGTADTTEMEIVSNAETPTAHVGSVVGGVGGSQTHIRFTNGSTQYIVHTMTAGSMADVPGQKHSGIAIEQAGGGEPTSLDCPETGAAQNISLRDVSEETYLEEQAGGPYDGWF